MVWASLRTRGISSRRVATGSATLNAPSSPVIVMMRSLGSSTLIRPNLMPPRSTTRYSGSSSAPVVSRTFALVNGNLYLSTISCRKARP